MKLASITLITHLVQCHFLYLFAPTSALPLLMKYIDLVLGCCEDSVCSDLLLCVFFNVAPAVLATSSLSIVTPTVASEARRPLQDFSSEAVFHLLSVIYTLMPEQYV